MGSLLESAVGSALSVAVASREHVHYPADVFTTERHYAEDLSAPEVAFERGADGGYFARAPDVAGIEPAPHPERLERATISLAQLQAG